MKYEIEQGTPSTHSLIDYDVLSTDKVDLEKYRKAIDEILYSQSFHVSRNGEKAPVNIPWGKLREFIVSEAGESNLQIFEVAILRSKTGCKLTFIFDDFDVWHWTQV